MPCISRERAVEREQYIGEICDLIEYCENVWRETLENWSDDSAVAKSIVRGGGLTAKSRLFYPQLCLDGYLGLERWIEPAWFNKSDP